MRLTVLGCAGTFPTADSGCSAYLLESEGYRLLVDAGTGAFGALQAGSGLPAAEALTSVDAVLLSHLHADHCLARPTLKGCTSPPGRPVSTRCGPGPGGSC